MEAKLDTGADTSSLDASKVRRYREKDGDRWVEFLVVDKVLRPQNPIQETADPLCLYQGARRAEPATTRRKNSGLPWEIISMKSR